jgi:two-component system, sensor histidine kinase and response regulator
MPDSGPANPTPRPGRTPFAYPLAWFVLVIALTASGVGWFIARQHEELGARKRFDEAASRIVTTLAERMAIYQDVLHGGAGLFAASYSVERAEWKAYVDSVSVDKRYPGVNGVGFIANVPRGQLADFLKVTRGDKTPDFVVKETGTNDDLFIVKYAEPEQRYRALLGVDIGTNPERREVAEHARDAKAAMISGKVTLTEPGTEPQTGFLMLLPIYRHGAATSTVEERRAAVEGWVFARFITRQLMQGILGDQTQLLRCEVSDTGAAGTNRLIFGGTAPAGDQTADDEPRFASEIPLELGGRTWLLHFSTQPAFDAAIARWTEIMVGVGGGFISLLLFGVVWSLSSTRERALAMATGMTTAFREANERLEQESSERKRSVAALKDSEILYHSLVESLPLQILRKDSQGRITFASQRFCTEVGQAPAEVLGKTDLDLYPPALAAQHQQADIKVLEQGVTLESVEEHPAADGRKRFIQVIKAPVRDAAGKVVGLLGICWDVTDKRHAEEELEHERFLLRTLMDNLPDRIYFKDVESRFIRVNKALVVMHGQPSEMFMKGKTDFDFFTDEHARQAFEDEQQVIRSGQPFTKEEKETWPDGSVTWVWTTKMPLRDEKARTIGTFGISRDITARRQAEEALKVAKEAAEEASRAKSQFLASMSHELRTPLNSVIGFANILLKNRAGNLTASELTFLERISANGKHLLLLINEILDLSKIEARKVELQIAPVALDQLIRETLAQQEGLVREKPVQLLADLPPNVTAFPTDAEKFRQIIINLVGNALKFTERGSVTVRLVTNPEDHFPLRVEVVDTGIGIPQDKLGIIFQAFQQAEAGTARKYGGTGLGLTISQALCQLMGYQIQVTSEVGRGSTFSVALKPVPEVATGVTSMAVPARPSPVPAGGAMTFPGKRVLVIDDELDSRTLLTHVIIECGCQVIAANSGAQGLQMAREFRPDLITLDLMMPSMDGWQVVRAIKADPALCRIPVVVVSVVANENRGHVLGAVDVLQKPVAREELLAVLQRNLFAAKPRILVVDDDEDARRVLASQLEGEAAEIRTAANGREALRVLEQFTPDLTLLDLMMPVMDGMGFLDAIRRDLRHQRLRVVVITAKELSIEEVEQLRFDALRVLNKSEAFAGELKRLLAELLHAGPRPAAGKGA